MKKWIKKLFERRAGTSYTSLVLHGLAARKGQGTTHLAAVEAVQTAAALWESGLTIAALSDGAKVSRDDLALAGRGLALSGNALFLLDGARWVPVSDWQVVTEGSRAVAYHLTLPDAEGPGSHTALSGEVLHFTVGADSREPWAGSAPYSRVASLVGLLGSIQDTITGVYSDAPIGSQVITTPEDPTGDNAGLSEGFRGRRGGVLLRESVQVMAAGGPTPASDWTPRGLTPDLRGVQPVEQGKAIRDQVLSCYGILPALLDAGTTAQAVREAQRHLAMWTLQPIADRMGEEISRKTGDPVTLDVVQGSRSYDMPGYSRALLARVDALAKAKAAGISAEEFAAAMGGGIYDQMR